MIQKRPQVNVSILSSVGDSLSKTSYFILRCQLLLFVFSCDPKEKTGEGEKNVKNSWTPEPSHSAFSSSCFCTSWFNLDRTLGNEQSFRITSLCCTSCFRIAIFNQYHRRVLLATAGLHRNLTSHWFLKEGYIILSET